LSLSLLSPPLIAHSRSSWRACSRRVSSTWPCVGSSSRTMSSTQGPSSSTPAAPVRPS
jgi:hypothetical protein